MSITSLIFLDIDGVINTIANERQHIKMGKSISSYKIRLPSEQILNLKRIVDSVPDTRIILSSSWRLGGPCGPDMKNLTSQLYSFGLYIDDVTPHYAYNKDKRGREILDYLNKFEGENSYRPPYIILDDKIDSIVPYHRGHIVHCNAFHGLNERTVNISINLLKKQRSKFF